MRTEEPERTSDRQEADQAARLDERGAEETPEGRGSLDESGEPLHPEGVASDEDGEDAQDQS